jgi:hypothetical protein
MKTTKSKSKIFTTALLGAAGAIALCAQQALALGMMGGSVGAHIGGMGSGHFGAVGSRAGASDIAGAVTMNGITVLPSGALIVPAVTPRVPRTTGLDLKNLDQPQNTQGPCRTRDCAAY